MKSIKLTEYESFLLQEALNHYKSLIEKEEFPKNSIVTKEYIEVSIQELKEKLKNKNNI